MSHHYVPWAVGFTFSILVGHLAIRYAARRMWIAVDLNPDAPPKRPSPWQPQAQGLVERTLYTAAILTGNGGFIAVWLAVKTAAQWKSWGEDQDGSTRKRTVTGREVYVNFILGAGLSIGFAAVGAYATRLLDANKITPASVLMGLATLAAFALGRWIEWRGERFLADFEVREAVGDRP
jgi:hypothetical protein